ncbi:hypothetical protein [Lentzea sp. NBRC 102530]|uniref:hypothetical protein n=1 Tax=Lentzea sp. NBRC 102530 TaxID=3032201 RepID=UPI0024A31E95|nr:hypothetical protein [Lentzea sp. NBRC 102530]GLY54484.1 hypothetical protein Lesp01_81400 [Lentzea sp. NBRC 102530]
MREGGASSAWARTVLVLAVAALLAAGVVNVLIAATEAVLWPVGVGVGWVVVAAGVSIWADAAATSRSRTPRSAPERVAAAGVVRQR